MDNYPEGHEFTDFNTGKRWKKVHGSWNEIQPHSHGLFHQIPSHSSDHRIVPDFFHGHLHGSSPVHVPSPVHGVQLPSQIHQRLHEGLPSSEPSQHIIPHNHNVSHASVVNKVILMSKDGNQIVHTLPSSTCHLMNGSHQIYICELFPHLVFFSIPKQSKEPRNVYLVLMHDSFFRMHKNLYLQYRNDLPDPGIRKKLDELHHVHEHLVHPPSDQVEHSEISHMEHRGQLISQDLKSKNAQLHKAKDELHYAMQEKQKHENEIKLFEREMHSFQTQIKVRTELLHEINQFINSKTEEIKLLEQFFTQHSLQGLATKVGLASAVVANSKPPLPLEPPDDTLRGRINKMIKSL